MPDEDEDDQPNIPGAAPQEDPIQKQKRIEEIKRQITIKYGFTEDEIKGSFPTDEAIIDFWDNQRRKIAKVDNLKDDDGAFAKDKHKLSEREIRDSLRIARSRRGAKSKAVKAVKGMKQKVDEEIVKRDQAKKPPEQQVTQAEVKAAMDDLSKLLAEEDDDD